MQVIPVSSSKWVCEGAEEGEKENLAEIEPNLDVPEVFSNVMIEEHAHISICSDQKQNPTDANYGMMIPSATYKEAMLHTDWNEWLAAMKKELQIMDDMHVY
jgi:hypothetical protein